MVFGSCTRSTAVRFVLAVAMALIAGIPSILQAEEADDGRPVEGVIVSVNGEELVMDLGLDTGLPSDAVVHVYRRLEVTHPVSGDVIVDRFPIGAVGLDEVGHVLSLARVDSRLSRMPTVGDYVVWEPVGDTRARPDSVGGGLTAMGEVLDPAARILDETFHRTLGRPLAERIAIWEGYVGENPESEYIPQVGSELMLLRELQAEQRAALSPRPPATPMQMPLRGHLSLPRVTRSDLPLDCAVSIDEPAEVEAVRLLARRAGQETYETVPMERSGDHSWRVRLEDVWLQPGQVEVFAEAVRRDGDTELIAGGARVPLSIIVEEPDPDESDLDNRSRAHLVFEFVDFDSGPAVDQYFRIEGDFQYVIDLSVLHAFRIGAGVFQGEGASLAALEAGEPTQSRNVNYGFAETELALADAFGVAWRFSLGNGKHHSDEQFSSVIGNALRIRIGRAQGTRLEIGGALLSGVGNEAWTEFFLDVLDRFPMSASVVVTNLPVGEDLGVSLNYGVGWRATDWFTLEARLGANARTIDHFGFTGGLGTVLEW